MGKAEYKGYTAIQASNNHVMIAKDGKMVLHSQCDEKKTSGELKAMIEAYITLTESGQLKKLPCRVGDTVYVITECQHIHAVLDGNWETATGYYCPYELYDRCPHECEECDEVQEKPMVFEDEVSCIHIDECGMNIVCKLTGMFGLLNDDIFLTMEEAQKALKERGLKCKDL